jgi:hypothetical protein
MENEKHESDAAAHHDPEKPETASKKTGLIQAISRSLVEPAPSIRALDALTEVQFPASQSQKHETVREAGIAGDIYRLDDQDCGGPTR